MAAMPEPAVKRAAGATHCLIFCLTGTESSAKNEYPNEFTWKEKHSDSTSSNLLADLILMMLTFNCNDKPLKIQISYP